MKIAVFSTEPYDRQFLEAANSAYGNELTFLEPRLAEETASLAASYPAV
jgi:D-lactate dehydrogenase